MSMMREFMEAQTCGFPHCTNGLAGLDAKCALVLPNGKVEAFCATHSDIVEKGGVTLVTLREANKAVGAVYPDDEATKAEKRRAEEAAFVAKLKRGQGK